MVPPKLIYVISQSIKTLNLNSPRPRFHRNLLPPHSAMTIFSSDDDSSSSDDSTVCSSHGEETRPAKKAKKFKRKKHEELRFLKHEKFRFVAAKTKKSKRKRHGEVITVPAEKIKKPRRERNRSVGEEDRISELPEEVLVQILSLLPTAEAIRTSVLAEQWRSLWTSVTSICFDNTTERSCSKRFDSLIKTLKSNRLMKLEKFSVKIHVRDISYLNNWIRFAVNRDVQELDLHLEGVLPAYHTSAWSLFRLLVPNLVLRGRYIANLVFERRDASPRYAAVTWKRVKSLRLEGVWLTENLFRDMLSASPVLEILELDKCHGFERLDVDSVSLRKLVLNCRSIFIDEMKLRTPCLLSLEIKGESVVRKFQLCDTPCLLNASFNLDTELGILPFRKEMWTEILHSVHHVNKLTIGAQSIQDLSRLARRRWHSPRLKSKCLKVDFTGRRGFAGLLKLLQSSRDLESLIIAENPNFNHVTSSGSVDNYLTLKKRIFPCPLKTVKIVYSQEWPPDLIEIVQFLLENARMLEEVIISAGSNFRKEVHTEGLLQVAKKLLCFRRSSNKAVICFEGLA